MTGTWENDVTLIRNIDGVIFKENGVSDIYFYETLTYTWARSTVTVDWATMSSYTGTVSLTNLLFKQKRDEWLTYTTGETEAPTIMGWMNNDYIFRFTYAGGVLTCVDSIAVPCNTNQLTAGCGGTSRFWSRVYSMYFDIGVNYIALLSPVNCAADYQASFITNASVRYYKLDTVWDIDADNDGIIDSTAGVTDDAVDWTKGWTCMDVPTSFNWRAETTTTWTGNWV